MRIKTLTLRMRQKWPVIVALVCLIAFQCSAAYSDVYECDFRVDGICYTRINDNEVAVSRNAYSFTYWGDIVIPEKVTFESTTYNVVAIGEMAFLGSLTTSSISLPPTIKKIDIQAFDGSGITSISLPSSLEEIEKDAFYRCDNLTSLTIPASVVSIGETIAYGCSSLMEIIVEDGNPNYRSIDGVLYTADCSTLLQFPCAKASIEFSPSLRNVASRSFSFSERLTSIEFPESLESIEDGAFEECRNLSALSFRGNALVSIGDRAFAICKKLKNLTLPNSLKHIGDNTFYGCEDIDSIELPGSLVEIGEKAFAEIRNLVSIKSNASVPPRAPENMVNDYSYVFTTLSVPEGSEEAYKTTSPWNKFETIEGSEFLEIGTIGEDGPVSVRVDNDEVIIEGAEEGTPVLVYDMSGRLVRQCAAPVVGITAPGAYLIVVGKEKFKVAI